MATRQTSEERRAAVLDAAMREFAERGYHAASTAAIAKRAGISQPYIYALFPSKRDLFLATHALVVEDIRRTFIEAVRGAHDSDEALHRMGESYSDLIADRYRLLFQLQAYACAGDETIGPEVSHEFRALFEEVERVSGATPEAVTQFFACGMLINVANALGLPELVKPALELAEHEAA